MAKWFLEILDEVWENFPRLNKLGQKESRSRDPFSLRYKIPGLAVVLAMHRQRRYLRGCAFYNQSVSLRARTIWLPCPMSRKGLSRSFWLISWFPYLNGGLRCSMRYGLLSGPEAAEFGSGLECWGFWKWQSGWLRQTLSLSEVLGGCIVIYISRAYLVRLYTN